jgi:hypothetical protein
VCLSLVLLGNLAGDHLAGGIVSRIRGMLKTAVVMKALQVAQRELSKPENQRKIKEGLGKVRDRVGKPRS